MSKISNILGKVFLWMLTLLFGITVLVYMPHFCCIIALIATALVIPISKWQNIVGKIIGKKLKILLVVVLFFAVALTAPTKDTPTEDALGESAITDTTEIADGSNNGEDIANELETPAFPEKNDQNEEETPKEGAKEESPQEAEEGLSENGDTSDFENEAPAWHKGLSAGVIADIEYAFAEIGENPEYIESVEYVGTRETALFYRRDYKVVFENATLLNVFSHETWVHNRFYRITTEEWFEGEPEREKYPREYLTTIKFWADDDTNIINKWTATGTGELQDASAGEYIPPVVN